MLKIGIQNLFMFVYKSQNLKSYLCCPDKFLDDQIHKWHIRFEFVYLKLCNLIYEYSENNFF